MRALVTAYGSAELKQLYSRYHSNIQSIISVAHRINAAMSSSAPEEPALRSTLEDDLRPTEKELRKQIGERVATELQSAND